MENKFGKIIINKTALDGIKDDIKQFGKDTAKEVLTDISSKYIKGKADEISNNLSDSAKKASEDKKELNDKYAKLRKLLISTSSDFKEYMEGIEEAQGVVNLYNHELDSLNKKNPSYLIKKKSLTSKQKKWETLRTSLSTDLTKKLKTECLKVYRTKEESSFFKSHSQINKEIISCNTEEDAKKINIELHKRYNVVYSTSSKA